MDEYKNLATLFGAAAFLHGTANIFFPAEVRAAVARLFGRFTRAVTPYVYLDVTEADGVSTNHLYHAVQIYLSSTVAPASRARLNASRPVNSTSFTFGLASNDRVFDRFAGAAVRWEHLLSLAPRQLGHGYSWRPLADEKRRFTLRFRRRDRDKLIPAYLDHIIASASNIRRRSQDRVLYTNVGGDPSCWDAVPFKHPSTFDTLAMDPTRKAEIMADLRNFADGRAFYERAGCAWKRGYLLYGPSGTGKSTMIAAMANFLRYDVYNLELAEVSSNAELHKLLMKTTTKSLIVVEDIDSSINLVNRAKRPRLSVDDTIDHQDASTSITLSGLLNFTDGLWSCCGAERIVVFTANHVEKLDPTLLRPGRMDMKIKFSFCSFPTLRILLRNHLGFQSDEELDRLGDEDASAAAALRGLEEWVDAAKITPADVSAVLIKSRITGKVEAMRELLDVLKAHAGTADVLKARVTPRRSPRRSRRHP